MKDREGIEQKMLHAVRVYKYYIPPKRREILTLQIFCCRKINFRGTKINEKFCINFSYHEI